MENNSKTRTSCRKLAVERLYSYSISGEMDYEDVSDYALELINGVMTRMEEIDSIIKDSLVNYTINRLNYVDLAIIRVATLELLRGEPKAVTINEAINLTKIYSNLDDDKAKAFNNRLLENICTTINDRK